MKGLTSKEEEIMNYFWQRAIIRERTVGFYDEPNLTSIRYRPS